MPEPAASRDDGLGDRLEGLFSAVKGPPRAEPRPPGTPPVPVEPADAPDTADGTILQAVDVARLVRYLDAQLGQARKEAAESSAKVLAAVQALDQRLQKVEGHAAGAERTATQVGQRLEEFAKKVFGWIESFSKWQTDRFDGLGKVLNERRKEPPPPQ